MRQLRHRIRAMLTTVLAVPTTREAFVLAFQVECLNYVLQPQKSPG
jgi:hypothetical protein